MLAKLFSNKQANILFLIVTEVLVAYLLKRAGLHSEIVIVACILWAVIMHGFAEFILFLETFKKLALTRTHAERLFDEFSELNSLTTQLVEPLVSALAFDKQLKGKEGVAFHHFLSELKYNYLHEYFVFNPQSGRITEVPLFYFEAKKNRDGIWDELIKKSRQYRSIQVLDEINSGVYLADAERVREETNNLDFQLKTTNSKLKVISKLFIIDDKWLEDGKIVDERVKSCLVHWRNISSNKTLIVKYMPKSAAAGILNNEVQDIGIFDDILGIQEPQTDEPKKLISASAKVSFALDPVEVETYKVSFKALFDEANPLSDAI